MVKNKWVDKLLLEKAITEFNKEPITVVNFECNSVVPTGDNYTSELIRASVKYKKENSNTMETISVIVKIQPIGNIVAEWTNDLNFFKTEMEMFSKTLNIIYDILGPKRKGYLSSLCLLTIDTPNKILVLEDLQPQGFKMVPKRLGFELDHCVLVMKKVAVMHAASVAMIKKDPSTVKNYSGGLFAKNDINSKWIHNGFQSLIDACERWQGYEKYADKLRKFTICGAYNGIISGNLNPDRFNVLNHGDLWTNNMLFSYHPNGKLKDLKFVDFQLVKYSSPCIDLHYFLATSPTDDVRDKYLDTLLDVYYGNLISTLTELKCSLNNVFTKEELLQDFKDRAFYDFIPLKSPAKKSKSRSVSRKWSVDRSRSHSRRNSVDRSRSNSLRKSVDRSRSRSRAKSDARSPGDNRRDTRSNSRRVKSRSTSRRPKSKSRSTSSRPKSAERSRSRSPRKSRDASKERSRSKSARRESKDLSRSRSRSRD